MYQTQHVDHFVATVFPYRRVLDSLEALEVLETTWDRLSMAEDVGERSPAVTKPLGSR